MFAASMNAGCGACSREQASLARLSSRADRTMRLVPAAEGKGRRRGGSDEDRPQPPWRKKHARKGKSYENQRRRRGRPEYMRSPDDTPLRDGNRDRLIGLLTLRAAKTLSYYLYETNPNVYHWLVVFIKENPIPQDGAWDDVSGDTFLRKLLSMPIEHTSDGMKRSEIYTMNKGCGVDPRNIAQRIMEIRTVIAKEMTQDLADIGEENSVLMRETLQASLQLSLQNVVAHPLETTPESPDGSDGSPSPTGGEAADDGAPAASAGPVQPPAPPQQPQQQQSEQQQPPPEAGQPQQQPQQRERLAEQSQQQPEEEQAAAEQPAAEAPAKEQQPAEEAKSAEGAAAQAEVAQPKAAEEQAAAKPSQPEATAAQPAAAEAAKQQSQQPAAAQQAAKGQPSSAEAGAQPAAASEANGAGAQPAAEGPSAAGAKAPKKPKRAKKAKSDSEEAGSEKPKGSAPGDKA